VSQLLKTETGLAKQKPDRLGCCYNSGSCFELLVRYGFKNRGNGLLV